MSEIRLADAVARFLRWAKLNRSSNTVSLYGRYLKNFLAWAGDVPVASLSPALITTWSRKFHPVQSVQRLTAWCHKEERSIAVNPLEGMRKIVTGQRRRILSPVEQARLLRAADLTFRAVLLALRESFARPQEVRAVRRQDVRQAGGVTATSAAILAGIAFFLIEDGKGYNRRSDRSAVRIIPISPRLGRLLVRLFRRPSPADVPIFLDSRRRPWTANAIRCRFRRLRAAMGLGADARGERVVAYTLRHTGATAAAAAGLRDWTLAEVLGHASTRTTARYVHLQAADVVEAMQRLWELKTPLSRKNKRPGLRRKHPD